MSLTTLSKVKSYLGIASGDTSDDGLLTMLIASADAKARDVMNGREIESASYTIQLDGSGTDELCLPQYPITAIAGVWQDDNLEFGDDAQLEPQEDFTHEPSAGILFMLQGVWTKGRRNVKVQYTAGYAVVPDDIEEATRMAVADSFTRAKQLASGQSQNELLAEDVGERSEQYQAEATECGLPVQSKAVFMRYRKPS